MKVKLNDIEVVAASRVSPDRVGCGDCVFFPTKTCPTLDQELEAGLDDGCVGGDHHYEAA